MVASPMPLGGRPSHHVGQYLRPELVAQHPTPLLPTRARCLPYRMATWSPSWTLCQTVWMPEWLQGAWHAPRVHQVESTLPAPQLVRVSEGGP